MQPSLALIRPPATQPLNVNWHVQNGPQIPFTSPAGAGMPGFQAGLPRANYSQELVVRAGQAPDDHAFYRIRRPNPTPNANHSGVRHPAGMTGAVARAEPDDGHRQVIRSRQACRDGRAPPRQVAATDRSGAFREGQRPLSHHGPPAARSVQGLADLPAVASAARPDRCDRALGGMKASSGGSSSSES